MFTEETALTQEIVERSAKLLRLVAEGKSTSESYFWAATLSIEALRDRKINEAYSHAKYARELEDKGDCQADTP